MDDGYLRGTGPEADGVEGAGMSVPPPPPSDAEPAGPVTPALYVSPTEGNLAPGEEARIRLTFTPKRAGVLSFALPVWLASKLPKRGTRPYLTLNVHVSVSVVVTGNHSGIVSYVEEVEWIMAWV